MRFLTLCLVLSLPLTPVAGQSPTAMKNIARSDRPRSDTLVGKNAATGETTLFTVPDDQAPPPATASARRNPYVGAQVGYRFGDGGDFANNLIAAGSLMYDVIQPMQDSKKSFEFALPVRGNIGPLIAQEEDSREEKLNEIVTSTQGIRIGIEPYLRLGTAKYLHPVLFGSAGWKLNAAKDSASNETNYLALGRFSLGFELGIGDSGDGRLPMTISVSPVYSVFANDPPLNVVPTGKKSVASYEFTAVVPIATSAALLTEAIAVRDAKPVWRIGLVFVGKNP
jgi:hypothetical protein